MVTLLFFTALFAMTGANGYMPLADSAKPLQDHGLRANAYRLDGAVRPTQYAIKITPSFEGDNAKSFSGSVSINTVVVTNTSTIILHSATNIKLITVVVCYKQFEATCNDNSIRKSHAVKTYEFLEIILSKKVNENDELIIKVTYNADFPEGMYGFYKSMYTFTSQTGSKREDVLLTTQFQPTHARKAFPCFDEPSYKAIFQVTLEVPIGYNAISNTEVETNGNVNGLIQLNFKLTPKMSTYLLAFIIYKEESYKSTTASGTKLPIRTWARAAEIDAQRGTLSQTDAPRIIAVMEGYTEIPYTNHSAKIDQAAIPDFSFGAMENWGLVTYRETALLFDEQEHTQSAKKRVSETIAHELSHQWFGNLVTTDWWGSAWLNEGFATYFEYYITSILHPDWRMLERMVIDEQLKALGADATLTASPLTADVNSPDEVAGHFGTITYSKGGSVLRMFEKIIGDQTFKKALREYLIANRLGSVTPQILLKALSEKAENVGLPEDTKLEDVLESWTNTSGYPVVTITRTDAGIVLKQEHFLADGTKSERKYNVRISLTSNDENFSDTDVWLLSRDNEVTISNSPAPEKWLLVPTNGYYRINYDDENWNLLIEQLRADAYVNSTEATISPLERAVLIDNVLNLARTNKIEYNLAIQVLSYLEEEADFIPWSVAFSGLNFIHRMLSDKNDTINTFLQHLLSYVYEELGFVVNDNTEDKNHIEHVHRANVLSWACRVGHSGCIKTAIEHLENYLVNETSTKVPADLRSVVYCYGVKHKDTLWPKLWKKLEETDDSTERSLLISALGCSNDPNTLYMYLETAILGGVIRIQDITSVFSAVNSNPKGVNVALEFLSFNLRKIEERTTTVLNGLSNIIKGTAQYINNANQVKKLLDIASRITNPVNKEIAQNAVLSSNVNLEWISRNEKNVIDEMDDVLLKTKTTTLPTSTLGAGTLRPAMVAVSATVVLALLSFIQ